MKTLKYGYFGEDNAQQLFLENYLSQLPAYLNLQGKIEFERDKSFKLKGHDKPNVVKIFPEAIQSVLSHYQQDAFFIGVDLDDGRMEEHTKLYRQITEKVTVAYKNKTFIFIPVQCIEHWLLYLKFKKEHPQSNKNEVFERVARPDAKKRMYGFPRPVASKQAEVVITFTQNMDIEWLQNRSKSFAHFHSQVINFLEQVASETA